MEKIWIKHYQAGVPAEIDPHCYQSVNEVLEEACRKYAAKPAFTNLNHTMTYHALEEKTKAFAAYLLGKLKLNHGDRVALMMPNILQYPVAMFGILRAGLVAVNVNPFYTARELEDQLRDSGCKAIVVLANFTETLQGVLPKTFIESVIVTEVGDLLPFPRSFLINWVLKFVKKMVPTWSIKPYIPFKEVLKTGAVLIFRKPVVSGSDVAFLQYTGGTTGLAKGAVLTHQNMVANIEQAYAWIKPVVGSNEIIITALPLYHIFSLLANCLTFLRVGALNVLITNPRDIPGFIRVLKRYPFTAITGVNTLFKALLNHPKFAKLNFSALRIALGGGMAVQPVVATRWKAITKVPLLEAYGLTETSPAVCINPLNLQDFNGSIGLPISSTDISIRSDKGQEMGLNETGELWVRGPQVMQGYWQKPEETALVLQDGWVCTGDIATIDQNGFVRIVDRKKDMILVSGFKVYPNEVEEVISRMKGVFEVAVIGVPSAEGERVKAYIIKKDPRLTQEEILEHCHRELTHYKVPKEIEFRKELPKSNVGKILRRALRDETRGAAAL